MTSRVRPGVIVLSALLLAACGDETAAEPPTPASPATSASPPRSPAAPASTGAPAPAGSGDRTGDLVRGRRTLSGTVERSGDWVLLRTDDGRWALLGRRGADLAAGASATVTGVPLSPPAGCPADRALTVYSVT
jgi:hypothetical protein